MRAVAFVLGEGAFDQIPIRRPRRVGDNPCHYINVSGDTLAPTTSSNSSVGASPLLAEGMVRVGTQTDILGECPLWNESEQALYWVDIRAPAIRRLDYASGRVDTWPMPGLVGSIAFVAGDHRLLVALPDSIALFDTVTAALEPFIPVKQSPGHRFNDGRVESGRATSSR